MKKITVRKNKSSTFALPSPPPPPSSEAHINTICRAHTVYVCDLEIVIYFLNFEREAVSNMFSLCTFRYTEFSFIYFDILNIVCIDDFKLALTFSFIFVCDYLCAMLCFVLFRFYFCHTFFI